MCFNISASLSLTSRYSVIHSIASAFPRLLHFCCYCIWCLFICFCHHHHPWGGGLSFENWVSLIFPSSVVIFLFIHSLNMHSSIHIIPFYLVWCLFVLVYDFSKCCFFMIVSVCLPVCRFATFVNVCIRFQLTTYSYIELYLFVWLSSFDFASLFGSFGIHSNKEAMLTML